MDHPPPTPTQEHWIRHALSQTSTAYFDADGEHVTPDEATVPLKRVHPVIAPRFGPHAEGSFPRIVFFRGFDGRGRYNVDARASLHADQDRFTVIVQTAPLVPDRYYQCVWMAKNGIRVALDDRLVDYDELDFLPDDDNPSKAEYYSRVLEVVLSLP